jgi:hypothetical protein
VNTTADAALQTAIADFQRRQFGWTDSRIDTAGKTIKRLRTYQNTIAPGDRPSVIDRYILRPLTVASVYATLPLARNMTDQAILTIDHARYHLQGKSPLSKKDADDKFAVVDTFFGLGKLAKFPALQALDKIAGVFRTMQKVINDAIPQALKDTGYFQQDPLDQDNTYAYTYAGGYTRTDKKTGRPKMSAEDNYTGPNLPENAIYICTGLEGMPADFVAYNTVHELAHFVGPETDQADAIKDHSYRHKNGFYNLTTKDALRTADSYAMFAVAAGGNALTEDKSIFMPPMIIRG